MQVEAERQAAEHAKSQLDEEHVALVKLQGKVTHLQESLAMAQSCSTFLESEPYLQEIIEEYRQSLTRKLKVVIACKAEYDYLMTQFLAEMRKPLGLFHYPPIIANYLDELVEVEALGGLDLGEDKGEYGDEASMAPGERTDEGGEWSTPPLTTTDSSLPLTPAARMDLS